MLRSTALVVVLLTQSNVFPQTIHAIPFASAGNTIELIIHNSSPNPLPALSIEALSYPSWLRFEQTRQTLSTLAPGEEVVVHTMFSVDKSAPVGTEEMLSFAIRDAKGENWTKEIRVSVTAPERFELFQNYPNPFNPTTAISYQLSGESRVRLSIFNPLGQEVAVLVDEDRPAGLCANR